MSLLIMACAPAKTPSTGTKAPYPSFVEPAIAFSVAKVPGADRWIHVIKFDGCRVQSISLEPFRSDIIGTGALLDSCFDAFSSREPVSTSLENALMLRSRYSPGVATTEPAVLRRSPPTPGKSRPGLRLSTA